MLNCTHIIHFTKCDIHLENAVGLMELYFSTSLNCKWYGCAVGGKFFTSLIFIILLQGFIIRVFLNHKLFHKPLSGCSILDFFTLSPSHLFLLFALVSLFSSHYLFCKYSIGNLFGIFSLVFSLISVLPNQSLNFHQLRLFTSYRWIVMQCWCVYLRCFTLLICCINSTRSCSAVIPAKQLFRFKHLIAC